MSRVRWRKYPLADCYAIGQLQLLEKGIVDIGGCRFRQGDSIHAVFDGGFRVIRPAGPGHFLVLERPYGIPTLFTFEDGTWVRWVRLYHLGQWRFYCHDVIRTWSIASPLVFVHICVYPCAFVIALLMLFPAKWVACAAGCAAAVLLIRFAFQLWRDRADRIAEDVLIFDPAHGS